MDETFRLAYSDGSIARLPSVATEIWRYMDFAKFVSILQHGALYFPVLASLGDELEAARPKLPKGSSASDVLFAWSSWNMWRCITFASCWHSASAESAAMWEIYAGRNQGIAIKSSLASFSAAFPAAANDDAGQLLKGGFVQYIDPDLEEPLPRAIKDTEEVLRKRIWYSYEQEFRAYYIKPDNLFRSSDVDDFELAKYRTAGLWVHCDLKRLIENVVVAPKSPSYIEGS